MDEVISPETSVHLVMDWYSSNMTKQTFTDREDLNSSKVPSQQVKSSATKLLQTFRTAESKIKDHVKRMTERLLSRRGPQMCNESGKTRLGRQNESCISG